MGGSGLGSTGGHGPQLDPHASQTSLNWWNPAQGLALLLCGLELRVG